MWRLKLYLQVIYTKLNVGAKFFPKVNMVCLIGNLLDCVQNLMGKLLPSDLKQFMLLKSLTENI